MIIQNNSIVYPKPTATLLAEKEDYWRITLPKDYRSFIMEYNGGVPETDIFYYANGQERGINRFLCILKDFQNNPYGWYDIDVIDAQIGDRLTDNPDLIGVDLLPIADLYSGNYLCLDFRKDRANPTVCIWEHEESGVFAPATYPVANNFTEFLDMLTMSE